MDDECRTALVALRKLTQLALLAGYLVCISGCRQSAIAKEPSTEPKSMAAAESSDFTLTFHSQMDQIGPGMYTYMTVTRVDGASSRALMFLNRHGGDLINRPVGLFATSLSRSDRAALSSSIDGIDWNALPEPTKGDISAASLQLDYSRGSHSVQKAFSASNLELLHALAPVMDQLDRLGGTLLTHPARAISVNVARTNQGFKLILKNVGTGPVLVADPRLPTGPGAPSRGSVGVARENDAASGFRPLPTITPISLQPPSGPPSILLAPGQSVEVETVPWSPPAPGKYMAKATWMDYTGPDANPKSVMPMIPDPSAEPGDSRPYIVRGAAFSGYIHF